MTERWEAHDWRLKQLEDGTPVPDSVRMSVDTQMEPHKIGVNINIAVGDLYILDRKVNVFVGPDGQGGVHLWVQYWLDAGGEHVETVSLGQVGGWVQSGAEHDVANGKVEGK